MPSRRARLLEVLLLAILICLWFAPLARVGLWESHNSGFDVIRGMGVIDAWRAGLWDARWFPSFDWGYGYPLLSFYAPLFNWMTAALILITGSVQTAAWLGPALWMIVGTAGVYLAASRIWDDLGSGQGRGVRPGLIAAIGWLMAPYLILNVHVRADGPEFAADQCYPWIIWAAWGVLMRDGRWTSRDRRDLLIGGLFVALAILNHNFIGMCAVGFALAMIPMMWIVRLRPIAWRRAAAWLGAVVWALAAGAFFWLPALAEKRYVQVERMVSGSYRYADHFLYLSNLIRLNYWDKGYSGAGPGDHLPLHLGWVSVLALASAIAALVVATIDVRESPLIRRRLAMGTLTLGIATALGVGLTMTWSAFLWHRIALLQYAQFPWRLLNLGTLGVCLLLPAGPVALAIATRRPRLILTLSAVLIGGCFALSYMRYVPTPTAPTELPVDLEASPVPIEAALDRSNWRYAPPHPSFPMRTAVLDEYRTIWSTFQLKPPMLPGDVRADPSVSVAKLQDRGVLMRLRVNNRSSSPQTLTVAYNHFPGWSARISAGTRLAIEPAEQTGYIRIVGIPPGACEVKLSFGNTPIRLAMKLVSGVAWILWLFAWLPRRAGQNSVFETPSG